MIWESGKSSVFWIRRLGFSKEGWVTRYRSQVHIPKKYLSRSDRAVCPDKFLERTDGYWDILDLKKADVRIMIRKPNGTHASAALTEAIAQVSTYVRLAREPAVRAALEVLDIRVLHPAGLLLIGRRPRDDGDAWEDVRAQQGEVKVYTYDDLLEQIEEIISLLERPFKVER
jgi:hypothetical protein